MIRLASILYSIVATAIAGSLVVVTLSLGHDSLWWILGAAALGAVIALPVAWFVAGRLHDL